MRNSQVGIKANIHTQAYNEHASGSFGREMFQWANNNAILSTISSAT